MFYNHNVSVVAFTINDPDIYHWYGFANYKLQPHLTGPNVFPSTFTGAETLFLNGCHMDRNLGAYCIKFISIPISVLVCFGETQTPLSWWHRYPPIGIRWANMTSANQGPCPSFFLRGHQRHGNNIPPSRPLTNHCIENILKVTIQTWQISGVLDDNYQYFTYFTWNLPNEDN